MLPIKSIVLAFLMSGSIVFAQALSKAPAPEHLTSYYRIAEPSTAQFQLLSIQDLAQTASDLLNWSLNQQEWPDPATPYNRNKDFGGWIRAKDSCQNTRAKLLASESQVPVQWNAKGCTVVSGQWYDPYTNATYTQASQLQIDHLVPLKNAYVSGASTWNQKMRCAYTNFMADQFHLIPVQGHANNSKGDRSPDQWLPSNQAFICTYIKDWLTVKLVWQLIMPPAEAEGIKQEVAQYHCDPNLFQISASDVATLRGAIQQGLDACN